MKSKLQEISILSEVETQLADEVRKYLKSIKFSGRIIFKTQPTTFIHPDWISEEPVDHRDALFNSVILFSLVKGHKESRIVLAIIDITSPNATMVASILKDFNVSVLVTEITTNFNLIHDFLQQVLVTGVFKLETKRVTNLAERWLLSTTDIAIGRRIPESIRQTLPPESLKEVDLFIINQRRKFLIFHEAALSAFLSLDPLRYEGLNIDWRYARTSRLDILVTSSPPKYTPLMAIEFDGPDHITPNGILKDKKKNQILESAGIPLLRISFKDAPPLKEGNVINFTKQKEFADKEKLLKWVIGKCLNYLHRERIEVPAIYEDRYYKKLIEHVDNSIHESRKSKLSLHTDQPTVLEILRQSMEALDQSRMELDYEIHIEKGIEDSLYDDDLIPESYKPFRDCGATLDNFHLDIDEFGGYSCIANFGYKGQVQILCTPVIYFRGLGFSDFDFDKCIKDSLKYLLIQNSYSLI